MTADPCVGYTPTSRTACHRPATLDVVVGCRHEHIGNRALCAGHLDDIRDGRMICGDCADHPTDPHGRCKLAEISVSRRNRR
jgi:hypothetical protein